MRTNLIIALPRRACPVRTVVTADAVAFRNLPDVAVLDHRIA